MKTILSLSVVLFFLSLHGSAADWTIRWEAAKGEDQATIPYAPRPLESYLKALPAGHFEADADISEGRKPGKSTVTELGSHKGRRVVGVELEVADTYYNRYFMILGEVEPDKFMPSYVHQYAKGAHGHGRPFFTSGEDICNITLTSDVLGSPQTYRTYLIRWDLKSEPLVREQLPGEHAVNVMSFSPEPNPVRRIVQALEDSGDDVLRTKILDDGGKRYSYHLQSVEYLGKIAPGGKAFTLASAQFIRSSPEGKDMPPARGHGFLLLLDADYKLVSSCRVDGAEDLSLAGDKLHRVARSGEEEIADFGLTDDTIRKNGFLVDGSDFLPYPLTGRPGAEDGAGEDAK